MAGLGPQLNPIKKKTAPTPPLKVESRIGIQAPAELVWDILQDIDAWSDWNPLYPKTAGTLKIGAPLTLTLALPGEPHRDLTAKVIDWVPYEQILWSDVMWRGWASSVRYFEIEEITKTTCFFSNGEVFHGLISKRYGNRYRRAMKLGFASVSEALKACAETVWRERSAGTT
jgi:hypothetical protein